MQGSILKEFWVKLCEISDPFSIRRPRRLGVFAGVGGDLRQMRSFVGVIRGHDPNIGVVGAVGVGSGTIAGKCQQLPVGRPCGLVVVEIAGSDLGQGFRRDIENVQMRAAAVEVADHIGLEAIAIDHVRARRFRFA